MIRVIVLLSVTLGWSVSFMRGGLAFLSSLFPSVPQDLSGVRLRKSSDYLFALSEAWMRLSTLQPASWPQRGLLPHFCQLCSYSSSPLLDRMCYRFCFTAKTFFCTISFICAPRSLSPNIFMPRIWIYWVPQWVWQFLGLWSSYAPHLKKEQLTSWELMFVYGYYDWILNLLPS